MIRVFAAFLLLLIGSCAVAQTKILPRVVTPAPHVASEMIEVDWPADKTDAIKGVALVALEETRKGAPASVKSVGFLYTPYKRQAVGDRIELVPDGEPRWRCRFAPSRSGIWTLSLLTFTGKDSGSAHVLTVSVLPGKNPGMIRRTPDNPRYLQYASGAPYFIVGENVCWSGQRGLIEYEEWFAALAKAGGNFARLWMAFSPIESKETGLGRYDAKNAAYFDEVLKIAQKHGIVCMLAFGTYGDLKDGGFFNEGKWSVNPYNAANGGPVLASDSESFFANEKAKAYYKKRLSYMINRYGAFQSLGFWEFWNEKGGDVRWFAEMARHLKANDPYKHLITNSDTSVGQPEVWQIPEMDFTQTHRYGDEGSIRDIAPGIGDDTRAHDVFNKPHLMGEFGISWRNPDAKFDEKGTATNFHNGLWSSAFSGAAGGASIWWWDNYIHPKNLYGTFTGLANFAKTVDWPRRQFAPVNIPAPMQDKNAPETFSDLVLSPTAPWGEKAKDAVTVTPSGGTTGGVLLSVLFGTGKPEQRTVQVLNVNLPKPSRLTMRVLTVSQSGTLRVLVDGKLLEEFPFNAQPGANNVAGKDFESAKQFPEYNNIYQTVFNRNRVVTLPAGKHVVTIENGAGDWMQIGSYTLANAQSSRYAPIRTYALCDKATGETLVWLQDPESNWQNDRDGKTLRPLSGVRVTLPMPAPGTYRAIWWDTRAGTIIRQTDFKSAAPMLTVPTFTRDIALRVVRVP